MYALIYRRKGREMNEKRWILCGVKGNSVFSVVGWGDLGCEAKETLKITRARMFFCVLWFRLIKFVYFCPRI